jgi:hypothetical protein
LDIRLSVPWLIVAFALMLLTHRWLETHIQGVSYLVTGHPTVATWVFFIIFLPGTLVHELSHWAVARLLGVSTGRITIWPQAKGSGTVWLGTILVGRADPIRSSLIGLAPLIVGSGLSILLGTHLQLNQLGAALSHGQWKLAWASLVQAIALPDFWLWLYLLFSVANRMLPSPADRHAWTPVLIFLALVSIVLIAAGWLPRLDPQTATSIRDVIGQLLNAFTLIVAVNLLVSALVVVAEALVGLLRGQRVSY